MNWFKTLLLLGVLGMTWVDCGRRPVQDGRVQRESTLEASRRASVARPEPSSGPGRAGAVDNSRVRGGAPVERPGA